LKIEINLKFVFIFNLVKSKVQFPRSNSNDSNHLHRLVYEKVSKLCLNRNLPINRDCQFNVGCQNARRCCFDTGIRKLWVLDGLQQRDDWNGWARYCKKTWFYIKLCHKFGFCPSNSLSWRLGSRKSSNWKSDADSQFDIVSFANHIFVSKWVYNRLCTFPNINRPCITFMDFKQTWTVKCTHFVELHHEQG